MAHWTLVMVRNWIASGAREPNVLKAKGTKTCWFSIFDNYGKQGLLCGSDGLPHLIVSGDQRHWGEFITPGILFLYIAGWIGWVGRSYLIAIRDEKKPTQKEIIIDVPLASRLVFRGFSWPVAAYREFLNGELIDPTV
ncbi:putative photosystem I PsaF, reaction centre subunit III [Helianthus anomalus]